MKPKIGIVSGINALDNCYNLNSCDVTTIIESGGIPLIIPYDMDSIDDYLSTVDGIYFTGGGDVNPILLNEDPHKNIGFICPERDTFEVALFKKAFSMKIPMLGVCRGAQIINISAGGTIFQDLNTQVPNHICHKQLGPTPLSAYFHQVSLEPDTILHDIYKVNSIYTNSYHHQSIKNAAIDFIVSARTSDGIIESIEYTGDFFILGIQWHPEVLNRVHKEALLIYDRFVNECNKYNNL
nr:gamma-glutamyl-gamma-aminobutyrate hydrolase family protein [Sedimentibacter sp.]